MYIDRAAIEALEARRRAALINSVTGFKAANLVGTADNLRHSNLAIMSSAVHIGSHPPLIALVFRPDTGERHSLANVRATGVFTINHVNESIIEAAHQTAARYPREQSEFAATGLGEHWREGFPAPFVAEASIRVGLALREEVALAINGTHLVIGEIQHLECPDSALNETGAIDPAQAGTVALAGLDSYYSTQLRRRMAYAKPDEPPRVLDGA